MDYTCKDVPMKLDVNHQPLNFDIYLDHRIAPPIITTLQEDAYDFQIELDALEKVNKMIERISSSAPVTTNVNDGSQSVQITSMEDDAAAFSEDQLNNEDVKIPPPIPPHKNLDHPIDSQIQSTSNLRIKSSIPIPSCPREIPLEPVKNPILTNTTTTKTITTNDNSINNQDSKSDNNIHRTKNLINPRDFEDISYNNDPFDHLELQTIDERRELGLVFQALHAESSSSDSKQQQPSVHKNHL